MNRYIHAGICAFVGLIKVCTLKAVHFNSFSSSYINLISPMTEITVDKGGRLSVGKLLKIRSGGKLRVRKNAVVKIGDKFSMSNNCMLVSRESITVGDNVILGPNVLIYDHDHDYRSGSVDGEAYKTSPVKIGNNVWIGANVMILRGTEIGDNCVVAAGTVLKGKYGSDLLIYQPRETCTRTVCKDLNT